MIAVNPNIRRVYMRGDLRECYSTLKVLWLDAPLIRYPFPFFSLQPQEVSVGVWAKGCLVVRSDEWTVEFVGTEGDLILAGA